MLCCTEFAIYWPGYNLKCLQILLQLGIAQITAEGSVEDRGGILGGESSGLSNLSFLRVQDGQSGLRGYIQFITKGLRVSLARSPTEGELAVLAVFGVQGINNSLLGGLDGTFGGINEGNNTKSSLTNTKK